MEAVEELIKQKEFLEDKLKLLMKSRLYKEYLEYAYLKSYYMTHHKYDFKYYGLDFKHWLKVRYAYKVILKTEKSLYPIQNQIKDIKNQLTYQKREIK